MAALPERERQAIEAAYFQGHSYRQAAAVLGIAEGTLKSRIRSGLRRLRTLLVHVADAAADTSDGMECATSGSPRSGSSLR